MRVVYDYGVPGTGRNRHAPEMTFPRGAAAEVQRNRAGETVIIISKEARTAAGLPGESSVPGAPGTTGADSPGATAAPTELTAESRARMQEHSRAIRLHEDAHMRVLGGYAASAVHYTEARAPDGSSYITGGRIKVDLAPVPGNPRATLRKARTIQRAALAPGDSSSADMATAAKAYRLQQEAMQEIRGQQRGEAENREAVSAAEGADSNGAAGDAVTEAAGAGSITAAGDNTGGAVA